MGMCLFAGGCSYRASYDLGNQTQSSDNSLYGSKHQNHDHNYSIIETREYLCTYEWWTFINYAELLSC